jgi:hypothetical protein
VSPSFPMSPKTRPGTFVRPGIGGLRGLKALLNGLCKRPRHIGIERESSLKVLSESKSYPIDLVITDGKVVASSPDDKGQTEISITRAAQTILLSG